MPRHRRGRPVPRPNTRPARAGHRTKGKTMREQRKINWTDSVSYKGEEYVSPHDIDDDTRRWWDDVNAEEGTIGLHDVGENATLRVSISDLD